MNPIADLHDAIVQAIDFALDAGLSRGAIAEEISETIDNYDWDLDA